MRRIAFATISLAALVAMPATVAAECNGPGCGVPSQPIDGLVIALTIAIVLVVVVAMGAAEVRLQQAPSATLIQRGDIENLTRPTSEFDRQSLQGAIGGRCDADDDAGHRLLGERPQQ